MSETARTTVTGPAHPALGPPTRGARAHACEEPSPGTPQTVITDSEKSRSLRAVLREAFPAPEPWAVQPPTLRDLRRYVERGAWTDADEGSALRHVAFIWYCLITSPLTRVCVYAQWALGRLCGVIVGPPPVKIANYRAPAPAELWDHARDSDGKPWRMTLVAASAAVGYAQWFAARPSRAIGALILIALLALGLMF